jgi:hypothetical protein
VCGWSQSDQSRITNGLRSKWMLLIAAFGRPVARSPTGAVGLVPGLREIELRLMDLAARNAKPSPGALRGCGPRLAGRTNEIGPSISVSPQGPPALSRPHVRIKLPPPHRGRGRLGKSAPGSLCTTGSPHVVQTLREDEMVNFAELEHQMPRVGGDRAQRRAARTHLRARGSLNQGRWLRGRFRRPSCRRRGPHMPLAERD